MTTQKSEAQGVDPKWVTESCFVRQLPETLSCGCRTKDVNGVGDGFQCKCGRLWKVDIVEDVPEAEFQPRDSVQVRLGSRRGRTGVVIGALTRTPGEAQQYVVELTTTNRNVRLTFAEHELETFEEEDA